MRAMTESDIRGCFVNSTKGEAGRLGLPRDLADRPWEDLDFLGWRDPRAPGRAHLVAERGGRPVGIALRVTSGGGRGFTARSMCSLCLTTRTGGGVALMTARRTGEAGRQGNTVGRYLCGDLDCSLYVRGLKQSVAGGDLEETLSLEEKVARLHANLDAFLGRVTG
ncbi:FBP domain-containing protein [Spirillospora sp. NPDC048819]|uniref:FBP domain-containing protein n=1 Tax=Spirillospora sp. NPDC048819 TaxID=3155268 RepID=UPI0033DC7E5D